MKKIFASVLLFLSSIYIWIYIYDYINNLNKPIMYTWLLVEKSCSISLGDSCFESCIDKHKWSPVSYRVYCKDKCCLLTSKSTFNIFNFLILILFIFLIKYLFFPKNSNK